MLEGMRLYKNVRLPGAILFFIATLILSACRTAPVDEALPTADVLVVRVTPSLRVLAPEFQACAAELPNTGLVVVDTADETSGAALTLRWGAEPGQQGYAAAIGEEELVVIVNPANPLDSIRVEDLRAIYQGNVFEWENTGDLIEAWAYPNGSDALRIFETTLMNGEVLNRHASGIVPNPEAMLEIVTDNPAAIGFIPARWLNEGVKALTVEGLPESQLRAPILAVSASEPNGTPRAWLICMQGALK